MLRKRVFVAVGVALVTTAWSGVRSAPVAITRDADASLLYRTVPSGPVPVRWVMPERATRATLTVTGDKGFSAAYADLSGTEQVLAFPSAPADADKEQVFTFTLAFDTGETVSARAGAVCGVADGDAAQARCRVAGTRAWARTPRRDVVPVLDGMCDFALAHDGQAPQAFDPGLDGASGWARLPLGEHGAYTLAATRDGTDVSAAFTFIPGGLAFIFR